jgi:hypothetical protein
MVIIFFREDFQQLTFSSNSLKSEISNSLSTIFEVNETVLSIFRQTSIEKYKKKEKKN